jgi:hypothetical protein
VADGDFVIVRTARERDCSSHPTDQGWHSSGALGVIRDEATPESSNSGLRMFGGRFNA